MKKQTKELTKTEWELMRICWDKGKSSAKVIHEESLKEKDRKYVTVKSMLDKLVKKNYLQREKFGPIWLYKPIKNEKKVTSETIRNFIQNTLKGNIAPIFLHVVNNKKIYRN
ncbi:BlaI/MecI/CopY family transcriptional regulator, partial [Candidatus Latescibacterota bacterium]